MGISVNAHIEQTHTLADGHVIALTHEHRTGWTISLGLTDRVVHGEWGDVRCDEGCIGLWEREDLARQVWEYILTSDMQTLKQIDAWSYRWAQANLSWVNDHQRIADRRAEMNGTLHEGDTRVVDGVLMRYIYGGMWERVTE